MHIGYVAVINVLAQPEEASVAEQQGRDRAKRSARGGLGLEECGILLLAEAYFAMRLSGWPWTRNPGRRDCRVISYSSGLRLGRSTPLWVNRMLEEACFYSLYSSNLIKKNQACQLRNLRL
jgi:hypothetical protein